jgi:hypothetical protein
MNEERRERKFNQDVRQYELFLLRYGSVRRENEREKERERESARDGISAYYPL